MAFGRPPIPNSADRRAWLRSYHYYRSKLMEESVGAEALALCQPLIDAAGGWTPPPPKAPPVDANGAGGSGETIETEAPENPVPPGAKNEAPQQLAGTPAGIHHGMPFFKEGRVFADPWRLPEKPKRVLKYYAAESLAGEDGDLVLPEPELWRKWTARVGQHSYGIGSLRMLDVLRGLRLAGILSELERADGRPIIWQIGPNGTIARALKLKFPAATILVSCEPWEMVSPIAFLRKTMADCNLRVVADPAELGGNWADLDYVFVPRSMIERLAPPRLDLTLDAMALQLSTAENVEAHARKAYELGCLFVFFLTLSGESPEWPIIETVPSFEPFFWLHQMPVRPVIDWQVAAMIDEGFAGRGFIDRPEEIKHWRLNNHFTMGWRRLRT